MAERKITRRRFASIMAAMSPIIMTGSVPVLARDVQIWRGTALGAESSLMFDGLDADATKALIAQVLGEVERLEQIFSLYRPNSELNRLNMAGVLVNPSHDMQVLLSRSLDFWRQTDGAFNPAIQPLWRMLDHHFSDNSHAVNPTEDLISSALALCTPGEISASAQRIEMRPGMGLTFNGIAQGYITDQVTGLLHRAGLRHVLVNLGEMRALPGRSWTVGFGQNAQTQLSGRAVATSSPRASTFSKNTNWHHLLNPATGKSANNVEQVSVFAPDATMADALSTALAVVAPETRAKIIARFPHTETHVITSV